MIFAGCMAALQAEQFLAEHEVLVEETPAVANGVETVVAVEQPVPI